MHGVGDIRLTLTVSSVGDYTMLGRGENKSPLGIFTNDSRVLTVFYRNTLAAHALLGLRDRHFSTLSVLRRES